MLKSRLHSQDLAASTRTADICVIGGGPAGSTVAHRMASFGHDVCLVERDASPRPHLAASLPSTILPLLEVIGARDRVQDAGFLRPEHIVVWWAESQPSIRSLPGPSGFHVDRREFDRLLLQNAQANGVAVLQPAHALRPERMDGGGWKIRVHHDGQEKEIVARFVVDASGGRNVLRGRRHRASAPLLAVFTEWVIRSTSIEGGVEAGEDEWFWHAPISRARSVVAVFLDPKRLSGTTRETLATAYDALLARSSLLPVGRRKRMVGPVAACDASSRYAEEPAGVDFIRVGDCCLSVDPLSSQGVQLAIASGLQAAVVVNTIARYPALAEAAIEFYRDRQRERVRRHAAKAATFYRERATVCDRLFWQQRAAFVGGIETKVLNTERLEPACRIRLSSVAKVESVPAIRQELIALLPALHHPALDRPVAFLHGAELVPFLRQIRPGQTAGCIAEKWSRRLSVELSWKILHWLWERRILVPLNADANGQDSGLTLTFPSLVF
jgi:flavin-dependent dehydrogenase